MATLDASIVNISLPVIMSDLNSNLSTIEWVVLVYLLVITGLLLSFGRLSDMVGRKKMFQLGLTLFSVGSALCAVSRSPLQLILSRVVQALGASMLMANNFTIITAIFPVAQRGRAIGIMATVVAVGLTSGPVLGGLLVSSLGWRSIFYVNVPIGILGTVAVGHILKEQLVTPDLGRKQNFDIPGAALLACSLTLLLLALTTGQEGKWGSTTVIAELVVAAISMAVFLLRELAIIHPLLDMRLFKNRLFAFGNLAALLFFLGTIANALIMPFFLQLGLGYNPFQAGMLMSPGLLAQAVVSPISGWLSDKVGARWLSTMGMAVSCAGLVSLSTLTPQVTIAGVLSRLVVVGIGQGLFHPPNSASIMSALPKQHYGVGGGFLSMMRNMGQAIGMALAGTILVSSIVSVLGHASLDTLRTSTNSSQRDIILTAFMTGLHRSYLAGAAICFIGIWVSFVMGRKTVQVAPQTPRPHIPARSPQNTPDSDTQRP